MKILQIGKYYHPYFGGMETVLKDLVEGLNQSPKIHIRVLCSSEDKNNHYDQVNNIEVTRSARFANIKSQPLSFSLFSQLRELTAWADIIHIHAPNPLSEIFLLLLNTEKKIFITHHSDIVKQRTLKFFYNPIYKLLLKKAFKIIVPTYNHIQHSDTLREFAHKVEIIPFGLRQDMNTVTEKQIEKIKEDHGSFILFVGRLVPYKGLDVLLKALKLTKTNLIIIGRGEEKARLVQLAEQLNISEQVTFLGRIEDMNEFKSFYHACDYFVLPSVTKNENFGMVQLEAMACSKPIITTNLTSGVPLVAEDGVSSLLVTPKSVNELTEAINKLSSDKSLQIEMGKNALIRYEEKYTYQDFIDRHISLFI